ncbi:MAG: hypothetical protein ACODTL_20480 [Brucella sp.]
MKGQFWKKVGENWERLLFSVIGLILLVHALHLIFDDQITNAGVVFGLGFLSFIYANVSRFKRFKGLGFEAELWEDKKKEAEGLIERLKEVVSIYTREVVLGKVKEGRWSSGASWSERWKLYDDLVTQHNSLGQKLDFSDIKRIMDQYFLFDLSLPKIRTVNTAIRNGHTSAGQKIDAEFGSPITDSEGYSKRLSQKNSIPTEIRDPFGIAQKGNLAAETLSVWEEASRRLKADFDVDIVLGDDTLQQLREISILYQSRPLKITAELIQQADLEEND